MMQRTVLNASYESGQLIDGYQDVPEKQVLKDIFIDGQFVYEGKMTHGEFIALYKKLQIELQKAQAWVKETGQKIVVLFDGLDGAYRESAIGYLTDPLSRRGVSIKALEKPSEQERGQIYFQRFVEHFPSAGSMTFFNRSWYNRGSVEYLLNYCDRDDYLRFVVDAPKLEQMLTRSGFKVFKYWLWASHDKQLERFNKRVNNPRKRNRVSDVYRMSVEKWSDFVRIRDNMFFHTDTESCPWFVVNSTDKWWSRIANMCHFLDGLDYPDKDSELVTIWDTLTVVRAQYAFPTSTWDSVLL